MARRGLAGQGRFYRANWGGGSFTDSSWRPDGPGPAKIGGGNGLRPPEPRRHPGHSGSGWFADIGDDSPPGPLVREGLLVEEVSFRYDVARYGGTLDELAKTAQFTVPVVVYGKRIARTRARFDCPWSVVGVATSTRSWWTGRS